LFADNHRVRGKTEASWYAGYASIRAKTKAEERRGFIFRTWKNEDIDRISVSGTIEIWPNGMRQASTGPIGFNVIETNDDKARRIFWQASAQIGACPWFLCRPAPMPPPREGTATHSGTRNGVTRTFTTSW